jgi:hypothetical protein
VQSTQATAASSSGEPRRLGDHDTPANLSPPLREKEYDSSSWWEPRMLTANRQEIRIHGQVFDERLTQKHTSGGLSESA